MIRVGLILLMSALVSACKSGERAGYKLPPPQVTMQADAPLPSAAVDTAATATGNPSSLEPRVQIFEGSDVFGADVARPKRVGSGPGDISLDFADADIRDVARTILGDLLKVAYTVDATVQGRITLKTSAPIARDDLLPSFEAALKSAGAALVVSEGLHAVVPLGEARARAGTLNVGAASTPGYGIEVVKLRYASAEEMRKLVEPLAPTGGIVSVEPARGLVIIAGTAPERRALRETMALFDVDMLKAMSYALVTPRHASVEAMAADLKSLINDSAAGGTIKIVALQRVGAVLIMGNRRSSLESAVAWVDRLDMPSAGTGRRLYYYRLQSAQAGDIVKSLSSILDDEAGSVVLAGSTEPAVASDAAEGGSVASAVAGRRQGGRSSVAADEANNALVIRASPAEYASIEMILAEMDRAPDQVLIEATVAEVSLDDQLRYGVEWFFQDNNLTYTLADTGVPSSQFPGFAFTYVVPDVKVAINALASVTDVNVVSSPKVLTLDNRAATLQVGDQVPIITQSARGVEDPDAPIVSSVQFRDTGILLNVTPRIGRGGMVILDVAQEVSDAVPTTTSGIDSPTIRQRRLQTTVAIQDGQTVALGGLMRQTQSIGESGVPILKDIPVVGNAFSDDSDNRGKTELLIFIRPRVIRTPAAARAMTADLRASAKDLRTVFRDLATSGPRP